MRYVKTRLWYVILLKYLKKICAMVYDHSSKSDIYLSAPFRQFMPSPTYILFNIGLTLSAVSCWPKNYTPFLGIRQNFPSSWPAWDSQRTHLSTALAWREKKSKHFVFNKYFSLVLGVLKSKISKKSNEGLGRKLDFKLFHYKDRVQPVGKITTIATRNRC